MATADEQVCWAKTFPMSVPRLEEAVPPAALLFDDPNARAHHHDQQLTYACIHRGRRQYRDDLWAPPRSRDAFFKAHQQRSRSH